MSDDAAPAKRGRKANAEKAEKNDAKVDSKKRARKEVKAAEGDSNDEGAAPVKRGRGRPKGSTKKKNSPAKPKPKGTGRRGRPKKEENKDSADEDGEENDAAEEDDD
ncbi:uncharacterized protein LOC123008757 [Tribolium madens]|uniref:uncharacterized protein LOC123008757 n=1 Tax=Tribolium madens TaxID=41895 RepID=UPI001CF739FA|nr:uncharacterized protein LOC123008757 [Tribolium madens]